MDERYPIGKYKFSNEITATQLAEWIKEIEQLPFQLRQAVEGLTEQQLDTTYREGGWTVRQVVHHIADSHLNGYTRFRLALTEDVPTIQLYDEKTWAQLPDAVSAPVEVSLGLLEYLHKRWVLLLRSLSHVDWKRSFCHPEMGVTSLDLIIGLYAWHGKHHLAHITNLCKKMKKSR